MSHVEFCRRRWNRRHGLKTVLNGLTVLLFMIGLGCQQPTQASSIVEGTSIFSVEPAADAKPVEKVWSIKRGQEVDKCFHPAADVQGDADLAEAAQALLMVIQWKHENNLLDIRPPGEAEAIMESASMIAPVRAKQTVDAEQRSILSNIPNVLIRKGVEKTQQALDPKEVFKNSFGVYDHVLSVSKDAIANSQLATRVEQTIHQDTKTIADLFKKEMEQAKRGNTKAAAELGKQRDAAVKHRAGAYAVRNDIDRSVSSIERNMGRLKRLKQVVDIIDAASDSKNPDYASGLASSTYAVIKDWSDSNISQAKELLIVKGLDADKAFNTYEQKHFIRERGKAVQYRGNLFGRMCQQGSDWVAAIDAESEAQKSLEAALTTAEWLKTAAETVTKLKALYEELDKFNQSHDAVIKGLDLHAHRSSRNMKLFARYFSFSGAILKQLGSYIPNEIVKSIADSTAEMLSEMAKLPEAGYGMLHVTERGGFFAFDSGRYFYAISPFHENFKQWHLSVYGHDELDRHYIVPPPESGWGKTVDEPGSRAVILNQEQFDQFTIAASTLTTLNGTHLTQKKFHELAEAVKRGRGSEVGLDYKVWSSGDGLFNNPLTTPTFSVSQLVDPDRRRYLELEVGSLLVRHGKISDSVLPEEAKLFKLPSLLSMEDNDANKKAHQLFLDYNLIWNHNELMWKEVYGTPLSLKFFQAVVAKKPQLGTELTAGSKLETRLKQNYERIKAQPSPPAAEVLLVTAHRPAWDELECEMVYQTSFLNTTDEVCRYFRIKVGDKGWTEYKPDYAEQWKDGARVRLKLDGVSPYDLQAGEIKIEGVVTVNGRKPEQKANAESPNPTEVVLHFEPMVKFDQFEVFPRPLKANEPVKFLLTAYVDDMFVPQKMPRVWFVLPHPDARGNTIMVNVEPEDIGFLDPHTLIAGGTINKLPEWSHGEIDKATVFLVFPGGYQFKHEIDLKAKQESPGKVQIATRRPKQHFESTEILVTSENLAELDDDPEQHLVYTLYVARTPDGPWLKLNDTSLQSGSEITPEIDGIRTRGNRLAIDQLLLVDGYLASQLKENSWPLSPPFFYRVGERWRTGYSDDTLGEETLSNVVGPNGGLLLVNGRESKDNIHLNWRRWETSVDLGMGPANQNVDFQNVHLIVKNGTRTRHLWTPRFEDGVSYGGAREEIRGNGIDVDFPLCGETTTLNISAEYPDYSARQTLTFVIDDAAGPLAERQKQADYAMQERNKRISRYEQRIRDKTAELARLQKGIEYQTEWIQKLQSRAQPNQNDINAHKDTRLRNERDVILVEAQIDTLNKCDIPFAKAVFARNNASLKFDFDAANKAATQIVEVERLRGKIELDRLKRSLPIEMQILDITGNEFPQKRQEVQENRSGRVIVLDDASSDDTAEVLAARTEPIVAITRRRQSRSHPRPERVAAGGRHAPRAVPRCRQHRRRRPDRTAARAGRDVGGGRGARRAARGRRRRPRRHVLEPSPMNGSYFTLRHNVVDTLAVLDVATVRGVGGYTLDPALETGEDWDMWHRLATRRAAYSSTRRSSPVASCGRRRGTTASRRITHDQFALVDRTHRFDGRLDDRSVASAVIHPTIGPLWASAAAAEIHPNCGPSSPSEHHDALLPAPEADTARPTDAAGRRSGRRPEPRRRRHDARVRQASGVTRRRSASPSRSSPTAQRPLPGLSPAVWLGTLEDHAARPLDSHVAVVFSGGGTIADAFPLQTEHRPIVAAMAARAQVPDHRDRARASVPSTRCAMRPLSP